MIVDNVRAGELYCGSSYIHNFGQGKHEHALCSVCGKVSSTDDGDVGNCITTGEALPADSVLNIYNTPLVCKEGPPLTHSSDLQQLNCERHISVDSTNAQAVALSVLFSRTNALAP